MSSLSEHAQVPVTLPIAGREQFFLGLFYRRCSGRPTFNVYLTEQFKVGLGGVMLRNRNRMSDYLYKFNKKMSLSQGAFAHFF